MNIPTVNYKREVNPEKCAKIEAQQINKKYILELKLDPMLARQKLEILWIK